MRELRQFLMLMIIGAVWIILPAQTLTVIPNGSVQAGAMLQFTVQMVYEDMRCDPAGPINTRTYRVMGPNGFSTEPFQPANQPGLQTYTFNTPYSVTLTDVGNPAFCFTLIGIPLCSSKPSPKLCLQAITESPIDLGTIAEVGGTAVSECSNCLRLDLRLMSDRIGSPRGIHLIYLMRKGRELALLGRAGGSIRLASSKQITLSPADIDLLTIKEAAGLAIRIVRNGITIVQKPVKLKIKNKF